MDLLIDHFFALFLVLLAATVAGAAIGAYWKSAPADHDHRRSALLLDGCPRCGRDVNLEGELR